MDVYEVIISKHAEKQLRKIPGYIVLKLQAWVDSVKIEGFMKVRKIPGFHGEALRGKREGQRSIRLNKAYRAIYTIDSSAEVSIAEIIEVNKHEY